MAEPFESLHVPQQSRRDKLRILHNSPPSISHLQLPQSSDTFINSSLPPSFDLSSNPSYFNDADVSSWFRPETSLSLSSYRNDSPLEPNPSRYGAIGGICIGGVDFTVSNDECRNSVPLGPFTGYASILNGSRFVKPAQQILDGFCGVNRGNHEEIRCIDSSLMDYPFDVMSETAIMLKDPICFSNRSEQRFKNPTLISMLDEVYMRYKLYCQQMQSVVVSFESVAGLGNAAPYILFAFKAVSKHFRCLKKAISDQIQFSGKALGNDGVGKDEAQVLCASGHGLHNQKPGHNSMLPQNPVWRSQRGLPDRAVAVLRAWLFEHFLHPYPTDSEKQMLAQRTGLSRNQVSNWFINARVRLWKPMVEEIHMLETQESQKPSHIENRSAGTPAHYLPIEQTPVTQFTQSKRSRNEYYHTSEPNHDQISPSYVNPSNNDHHIIVNDTSGGSNDISLALGLHQNNRLDLSHSFPLNITHQFGLESNSGNVSEKWF